MRTREAILQDLATEQANLAELERELSTARGRIDALRDELQNRDCRQTNSAPPCDRCRP